MESELVHIKQLAAWGGWADLTCQKDKVDAWILWPDRHPSRIRTAPRGRPQTCREGGAVDVGAPLRLNNDGVSRPFQRL